MTEKQYMDFRNITNDKKTLYRLGENEQVVFLMENRDGEIVFELAEERSVAHIFAFYTGKGDERFSPRIIQRHLVPDTVSSATVRAQLDESSSLDFRGLVEITKSANRSDAKQDCRALLLSTGAHASAKPELEIDTDDVTCSHSAAISAPDSDQIDYLATRDISRSQAITLIADGFFKEAREVIEKLTTNDS